MDSKQREGLRYAMNTQFRYKFYNQTEFPFLPSMGIRHIFQSFEAPQELGYIGMLHLWWTMEDNGIVYNNPRNFVKGIWHGEWFDKPEEGIERAIQIQKDAIYDMNKLLYVHHKFHNELRKKEAEKKFTEEVEEMDDPKRQSLLN